LGCDHVAAAQRPDLAAEHGFEPFTDGDLASQGIIEWGGAGALHSMQDFGDLVRLRNGDGR
jgi:hypothetical protein